MQPCYADVEPYLEEPDDTATVVFPRVEHPPAPEFAADVATAAEPCPDGPDVLGQPDDTATVVLPRVEHPAAPAPPELAADAPSGAGDEPTAQAAKGTTATGVRAALGAVVTGGLVASQFSGTSALVDVTGSDSGTAMLTSSVASATILAVPNEPDAAAEQRDIAQLHKGDDLVRQASAMHTKSVQNAQNAQAAAAAAHEAYVLRGGGNLDDWISVALRKLNLDQAWSPAVKRIIMEESRGNPRAINRWDSNAMAGRPSQGLMQVIPTTFQRYVLPELAGRPITDPVANITAGIRYMLSHYGYLTLGQGGRYVAGQYVGY